MSHASSLSPRRLLPANSRPRGELDCLPNFLQNSAVGNPPEFQCDIRSSFATAFKRWREKKNLPLKKIAKELGVAVATINAWELGKRFPTAHNFEMLVNYSGVPPCKLFCIMADKCVPAECLLAMGRQPDRK